MNHITPEKEGEKWNCVSWEYFAEGCGKGGYPGLFEGGCFVRFLE